MSDEELEAIGLYRCPSCSYTYESEAALMFCCSDKYDQPNFVRAYD